MRNPPGQILVLTPEQGEVGLRHPLGERVELAGQVAELLADLIGIGLRRPRRLDRAANVVDGAAQGGEFHRVDLASRHMADPM